MRNVTLTIAALTSLASAQQVIVPKLQALASTSSALLFQTTSCRFQAAYDSSLFTDAGVTGPITIHGLHFRHLNGRRNPNGQSYANVTVEVGTCAVDHAAMVTAHLANRGVMGPLGTIPIMTVGAASGTVPNDDTVNIDLVAIGASVVYDPTTGVDLLIDITMPTPPSAAVPGGSGGGTVTAGVSTTTVTQAAGHTYVSATGSRIRMTSGVNNGLIRTISSATATAITHAAFPVLNLVGDTFVCERLDMENTACSNLVAHLGRRVSSAWTLPALPPLTGTASAITPVCRIDFSGPGGFSPALPARVESYGAGCSPGAASFYQFFPVTEPFDLRGPGRSLELTPDNPTAPNFYTVTSGTTAVDLSPAAISGVASIQDDAVTTHIPGFTFNFPGGSTTQFGACPNGYVWLGTNTTGDFSPTLAEFLGSGGANTARMAVAWNDMHAGRNLGSNPGSGMYVATDLSGGAGNGVTYVTWKEIGEFNSLGVTSGVLPPQGFSVNTFQMALYENGNVSMRYGAMSGLLGGHPGTQVGGFTGFSRGQIAAVNAIDPGSRDLSIETPFMTGAEGSQAYLGHGVSARAVLGNSITFTAGNHPAGTLFGAILIGFDALRPGINFFPLNPGCIVSLDPATAFMWELFFSPAGTVTSVPFAVPAAVPPVWMGAVLNTQYVVLLPDGSVSSSNALKHTLGLQ